LWVAQASEQAALGFVEWANAAKAAIPRATAARKDGSSWQGFRLVVESCSIWERQGIQVRNRRAQRIGHNAVILPISNSFELSPIVAGFEGVQKFDECGLALEPNNGIQLGHSAEDLFVVKAGIVTARCNVGLDVILTERPDDLGKVGRHVLKDQRETDHVGILSTDGLEQWSGIGLISHHGG